MRLKRVFTLASTVLISFAGEAAFARKFDFKSASVATYLRGTYGTSGLGQGAFENASGASTSSFSESVKTEYSGEFGVLFSASRFNLRLGAEMVLGASASETKGKNAAGTELFNVDSGVSALIPTATLELVAIQTPRYKLFFGFGAGYATVKLENQYAFTADGTTTYSLADFKEGGSGKTTSLNGSVGYEIYMADNSTFVFDLGYRQLKVDELKYDAPATGFQGAKAAGDVMVKSDGSNRSLDMSGAYVGIGFRFYLDL